MTQASATTFQDPDNSKKRLGHKDRIFEIIKQHGPINGDKIVFHSRIPLVEVMRRVDDLQNEGKVYIIGAVKAASNRDQSLFMATPDNKIEIAKKSRHYKRYIKWLKQMDEFRPYIDPVAYDLIRAKMIQN